MADVTFTNVTKQYPNGFTAVRDLDLEVSDGELLVVVGPSGCGKTTTLRMLAGLEDISDGEVRIGDRVVNELSAKERDIAMVFQSYALYPHLSVADNLGYPLRMAKLSKADRKDRVLGVAKQLQLDELLDRKPRQLSGGQRQRVAMGRAMVREPSVFLMDEPLSNLDAKLRVLMRSEVAELQQSLNTTMFYVTHDQIEAMTMGHRVAIMDRGVLQQVAAPDALYTRPANTFVAGFIGSPPMNLFEANVVERADSNALVATCGRTAFPVEDFDSARAVEVETSLRLGLARDLVIGIRPEHVQLSAPATAPVAGTVRVIEMLGSETLVHVEIDGFTFHTPRNDLAAEEAGRGQARLIAKVHDDAVKVRVGDTVGLIFPAERLHVFDAATGTSISEEQLAARA